MSTVDLVEQHVLENMLRGKLTPGERIGQDTLAHELGVSKIPVREALQRLAARDLVRFETNRGAIVPRLTASEARENFALRRAIEPVLLEQALPNLTIVDLAEAELALTASDSVARDNWLFHRALYRASAWQRGLGIARILHAAVAPYVLLYVDSLGGKGDSDQEHHDLLQACRDGNREAATSLLDTHLTAAESALVDFLPKVHP